MGGNEQKISNKVSPTVEGIPGSSDSQKSAYNSANLGSFPGSGRSTGEENSNPLQDSCLENSMDGGAWWITVPGAAESDTTERLTTVEGRIMAPERC